MRQHHRHTPCGRSHRLDHVLHPGVVTALARRHSGEFPAVWIAGPDFFAPFLQRERRIGDDAIECGEIIAGEKGRLAERVAAHDLEIRSAMQK